MYAEPCGLTKRLWPRNPCKARRYSKTIRQRGASQAVVWVGLDFGEVIEWVRKKANAVCRLIRKTIFLLEQSRLQMASFLTASTEAEYLQRMHQALKTSTDGNKRQVNHLRQKCGGAGFSSAGHQPPERGSAPPERRPHLPHGSLGQGGRGCGDGASMVSCQPLRDESMPPFRSN
jgi:hypothetical protein